jgi:hypothetical protein
MPSTELDWAVRTTNGDTVSCDSQDTATELASDKPHLTVIYRRPGCPWLPVTEETSMDKLNPDALAESGTDLDERPEVQPVAEAMIRAYVIDASELPRYSAEPFAAWLYEMWNDFNEDGTLTNGEVIAGALADWRGQ